MFMGEVCAKVKLRLASGEFLRTFRPWCRSQHRVSSMGSRAAIPDGLPEAVLEQDDHEGAEGDRATQGDVEGGSQDGHRRVDRRRQARSGLRPNDPAVSDL